MEAVTDYSRAISGNLDTKLNFLSSRALEIQQLIQEASNAGNVEPKVSRKRKCIESQSCLKIRPVQRRSSKVLADVSDVDPDTDYGSPEREPSGSCREPLERRLGIPSRPNQYGAIEGVVIGLWWKTRLECSYSGAHRPTVAGIHPGPEGAYSVALSGGYEGDWDSGNEFIFTGEGGRDLKGTKNRPKNLRTAPQSRDQMLTKGNLALHKSLENGNPVRVIRGYKVTGGFAPPDGYRYDGLYQVTNSWTETCEAGFLVYKFQFSRLGDQLPLADSIEGISLFTTVKTEEVGASRLKSRSSVKRRSVSRAANDNAEDGDPVKGFNNDNHTDENDECKDVAGKVTSIVINESLPMFYRGRFLGFDDSHQYSADVQKTYKDIMLTIEKEGLNVLSTEVFGESNFNEDSEDNGSSSNIVESSYESSSRNRRKGCTPRKVVRKSFYSKDQE